MIFLISTICFKYNTWFSKSYQSAIIMYFQYLHPVSFCDYQLIYADVWKKNISRELTLKAVFKQNSKQGKFLASFYWLQPLNIKHFWRKTNADWILFCFVLFIFMMIMTFVRLLGIFVTVSKMPWSKIS